MKPNGPILKFTTFIKEKTYLVKSFNECYAQEFLPIVKRHVDFNLLGLLTIYPIFIALVFTLLTMWFLISLIRPLIEILWYVLVGLFKGTFKESPKQFKNTTTKV
jgi:hypothetical protein